MTTALILASLLIAVAAGVDSYYSVRTNLEWPNEYNPLAMWILKRWGLRGLIGLKTGGTAAGITLIWAVSLWSEPVAVIAGCVGACGMAGVVAYLWVTS